MKFRANRAILLTLGVISILASAQLSAGVKVKEKKETEDTGSCGLPGFWFDDKILAHGLEIGDTKLIKCSLRLERKIKDKNCQAASCIPGAPVTSNRFCKEGNCLYAAKDDAAFDALIMNARKESLLDTKTGDRTALEIAVYRHQPGVNDKLVQKWVKHLKRLEISEGNLREEICHYDKKQYEQLLGKAPEIKHDRFKKGDRVYNRETYQFLRVLRLCPQGALAKREDNEFSTVFNYKVLVTAAEGEAMEADFARNRALNAAKRNPKKEAKAPNTSPRLLALEQELDNLRAELDSIESQIGTHGQGSQQYGSASKGVTDYRCDERGQNCGAKYQGGGESASSYYARARHRDEVRKLEMRRTEIQLRMSRIERDAEKEKKRLQGEK
ncbi:MAG: hypothetical protein J0L53_00410 [Spirochaetes bacterium]|nr:hypothetical protein [Spirochaetota bacterium]